MIFKRFFYTIGSLFMVVAFFRTVNGATSFSLSEFLLRVQAFDFDYSFLSTYLSPIKSFAAGSYFDFNWGNTGTSDYAILILLENVFEFFKGLALFLKDVFVVQLVGSWNLVVEIKDLVTEVYDLFTYVLGFR